MGHRARRIQVLVRAKGADLRRPSRSLKLQCNVKVGFLYLSPMFAYEPGIPIPRSLPLDSSLSPGALRAPAIHDRDAQGAASTALRNGHRRGRRHASALGQGDAVEMVGAGFCRKCNQIKLRSSANRGAPLCQLFLWLPQFIVDKSPASGRSLVEQSYAASPIRR